MNARDSGQQKLDELLAQVVEDYTSAIDAGKVIDIDAFANRYPEHATQIRQTLTMMESLESFDQVPDVSQAPNQERRTIGDFELVREVGRGGMGIVYEARQISIDRRVAIKVLPFAALADSGRLKRFKNEIRAAGALHHPNIVSVYSVGVERGVHFFAMQHIDGPSLEEVIGAFASPSPSIPVSSEEPRSSATDPSLDETELSSSKPKSRSSTSPNNSETIRQIQAAISTKRSSAPQDYFRTVAKWGQQISDALSYAHESGILHRDIKPGNVLLDENGRVWIVDFGLARIQQDASVTMTGDILGTLRYMAPEQALAKRVLIDHRADVYSLGATLYELLTLTPVFVGKDREELLQKLAFEEPTAIRKLNPAVPSDLETIVLRALEKNPDDRFASAAEMASELQRFLDDRPLSIRPVGPLGRVARYCRKRPAMIGAFAGMLMMAVISLLTALGVTMNSRAALIEAVEAEREQRKLAAENLALAKDTVDEWYVRFADEWLKEQEGVGLTAEREELLQKAADFYSSYVAQNNDSESRRERASTLTRLARVKNRLGDKESAIEPAKEAIDVLEDGANESPNGLQAYLDLAEARKVLALILTGGAGNWPTEASHQATMECVRGMENIPDELKDQRWRYEYAGFCSDVVNHSWAIGKVELATRYANLAVDQNQILLDQDPENDEYRLQRFNVLGSLIQSRMHWTGKYVTDGKLRDGISRDDTVALVRERQQIAEERLRKEPDSWEAKEMIRSVSQEASYFFPAEEAEPLLLHSLQFAKERFEVAPDVPAFGESVRLKLHHLERLYGREGNFERALEMAQQIVEYKLQHQRRRDGGLAGDYFLIGQHSVRLERPAEAISAFRTHNAIIDELINAGDDNPELPIRFWRGHFELAEAAMFRANQLIGAGKTTEALEFAAEAFNIYIEERKLLAELVKNAKDFSNLPLKEGSTPAIVLRESTVIRAIRCANFARKLLENSLSGEASVYMQRSMKAFDEIEPQCVGKELPEWVTPDASILAELAWFLATWPVAEFRDPQRAIEMAMRAERLQERPRNWHVCGIAHLHLKDWEKCIENLEKSTRLRKGTEWPPTGLEWFPLAVAHHHLGNEDEARRYLGLATTWYDESEDLVRIRKKLEAEYLHRLAREAFE